MSDVNRRLRVPKRQDGVGRNFGRIVLARAKSRWCESELVQTQRDMKVSRITDMLRMDDEFGDPDRITPKALPTRHKRKQRHRESSH